MRRLCGAFVFAAIPFCFGANFTSAAEPVRIGVLGFDNYQGFAYAQLLNNPKAEGDLIGAQVTAVYPLAGENYPEAAKLRDQWQAQAARFGTEAKGPLKDYRKIEFVDSVEALLKQSDVVLLMTLDGRDHVRQAEAVLKAGKPLYIGRPAATSLADVKTLFALAASTGTPCWSSSQHRFSPGFIGMRDHAEVGRVLGCDVYGGFDLAAAEADKPIRALHSLETLYTIMGPGVATVAAASTPGGELYTLTWTDGRIGTYRGITTGKVKYSATVFGEAGVSTAGVYGHGVPVQGVVPTKDKYMG